MATARAFLSLVMLTGFYFVAFVQFAIVVTINWFLSKWLPGPLGLILSLPLYAVAAGSVLSAWWAAIRARHLPLPGVTVSRTQAAPLWTMVDELARRAQTRPPDEIRIVAEVNAAVSEASRLLGLWRGRRYLYLGLPLLRVLTGPQLQAIIAHELGHYSHAHTRLGAIAYRGRAAISGTVGRIHPRTPLGAGFRAYYRLYLFVDRAASRVQELQADAQAVRSSGRAATVSSLVEIHTLASAFTHFVNTQIAPRAEYGYLPADLYDGFATFLSERQDELGQLRQSVLDSPASVWDTHPSVRERIHAIERLPEPAALTEAPAQLVGGLEELAAVMIPHVLPRADCQFLPWDEFVAAASSARLEAEADAILREARRALGTRTITLAQILDLARRATAQGSGHTAAEPGDGKQGAKDSAGEAAGDLAAKLPLVLALAILRSGSANWRPSWSGPAMLVDPDGQPLPLADMARAALKPDGDALLTRRLRRLGITLDPAALDDLKAPDLSPRLVAGFGNVNVGTGSVWSCPQADLIVLNTGLVLMETSRDTNEGNKRLREVLGRMTLSELMASYPFTPFAEVSQAVVKWPSPFHVELTLYDGKQIVLREAITGDRLTDDSADALTGLLKAYT